MSAMWRACTCRDHAEERVWRHLGTCQFGIYLHARIPRIECPEHGMLQVKVPWAEPRSRFNLLFERFVIAVIEQCAIVQGACRLLRMTWDEVWACGQSLTSEKLDGIDAVAKDRWSLYIQATLACVPNAAQKIVFDRFHIVRHMVKAVDTARKQEHRQLTAGGTTPGKGPNI